MTVLLNAWAVSTVVLGVAFCTLVLCQALGASVAARAPRRRSPQLEAMPTLRNNPAGVSVALSQTRPASAHARAAA